MNTRFVGFCVLIAVLLITTTSCNIFTKPDKNRVAKPTFSPEGGAYDYGQAISIFSSTPGASIFYSMDGSSPTIPYVEPIILSNGNHTLKAVATRLEWMFAARGGNQSQGYTYSGSNTIDDVAWYDLNSGGTTHDVGTKAANELGIFDMTGNVWEWCWDILDLYPGGAQTDPHGATSGSSRVARGCSWHSYPNFCTVSYRLYYYATDSYNNLGFRCVRVSP
ncbi:MAG: SUMF1/EgtB/PvdO family nonheme iron enzyme [Candidatus Cloacimonadota bacterium]